MAAAAIVEVEDDDVLPSPIIVFAMPLVLVNCCCLRSADDDVCRARAENMINLIIFHSN